MANTTTPQHAARTRYGFQYWTILLVLNLTAAFKGQGLDKILFVDGLIVAVFGVAAIVTWSKKIWFRREPN